MRRVVFWGHLSVAVVVGTIIAVKAITGLTLTLDRPVTAWANRGVERIEAPSTGTARLPTDALVAAAMRAKGRARAQSVTIPSQPDRATVIALAGGATVFVNPYSGVVTGESSPRTRAFFAGVLSWHRWFDVDPANRAAARAVGAAATIAFLFLLASGVFLWVPPMWSRARWRFALWFRRGLRARGRDLNWHHVVGVWTAAPLAIVLGTGVVMSYGWANDLLYRAVGDTPPARNAAADAGGPRRGGGLNDTRPGSLAAVDVFLSRVPAVVPSWQSVSVRVPNAGASTLTATVDDGDGGEPQRRGTATVDAATGAIVRWEPFAGLSAGRRARSLARFLHTGEALGPIGQVIAAMAMIGAVLLVWTGFAMAWRRAARWLPSAHLDPRVAWPAAAAGVAACVVLWQLVADGGMPNPLASAHVAWLDISVLVFREGLECVLVLSAITASFTGASARYRRPVAAGAAAGLLATAATWAVASRVIDDLARSLSALAVQAATGLLAVAVLLVVMNWFFHKVYWTGWIAAHTNRKRVLLDDASRAVRTRRSLSRVMFGLAVLGFTSLYREGVEVVLFLQSYRLRLGSTPVAWGVAVGGAMTAVIAVVTFVLQRRLPYRRMLVLTGVLLGGVLLVMVGEQAQEMQQAGWLPTTTIPWLTTRVPAWAGLWLSVFPTIETLAAQALAALLVLGSYFGASRRRRAEPVTSVAAHAPVTETPGGNLFVRLASTGQAGRS